MPKPIVNEYGTHGPFLILKVKGKHVQPGDIVYQGKRLWFVIRINHFEHLARQIAYVDDGTEDSPIMMRFEYKEDYLMIRHPTEHAKEG